MLHFIQQSCIYPYWWRNIGTGYPRNILNNIIYYSVGGGGLYKNRENPIYKIYQRLNK